ncbi:MAG: DUF4838 domain-containing protein [Spirochaetaceae bacterium]|jgi:hypothetical protein|nr:DUF4838 domain-containing protein [Spirochaetaceae bacterium]
MIKFDVARDWTVLVSPGLAAAQLAGDDFRRILALLRAQAGSALKEPPVRDSSVPIDSSAPVIALNGEPNSSANGFSWRLGIDRIEICGASERGLCNGIYDFLAALGVNWPEPGQEVLPKPLPDHPPEYPLRAASAYQSTTKDPGKLRRLVFTGETPLPRREDFLVWAARNRIDALVLPFTENPGFPAGLAGKPGRESLLNLAKQYALSVEIGGWELGRMVPRRPFTKKDIFRMEGGKRVRDYNFCPTNPDTIALLKTEARKRFGEYPDILVFHLWPDRNAEHIWCSCPSCRAFSREEQNRIAVNTAADILAETSPGAIVSYYEENTADPGANPNEVSPRPNMFRLRLLPGQEGAEKAGVFLAGPRE